MSCTHLLARLEPGTPCPACAASRPSSASAAAPDLAALVAAGVDLGALARAVEASLCRESFADFVAAAWSQVVARPYVATPAAEAMIEHLQAIGDGRIRRLLVAIAPGLAKSTLCSVLYPAWRWARDPAWRGIFASHAHSFAVRDSQATRRLVASHWFRSRFGVELRDDENRADNYATTANGRRIAVGVGGALTGHRADDAHVDDSINAVDARSKAARDTVNAWFTEALSTRIDGDGALVVVQQRLHPDDLIGHLLEHDARGWEALILPAEFDPRRRTVTSIWQDPRTAEGELIAPEILPGEKLGEQRRQLGSAAFECQYNQNPSSDESSMFKRWRFYRPEHAPEGARRPVGCYEGPAASLPERFSRVVIAADLTFGSAKGDFSVVEAWASAGGARYLLDHWRKRAGFEDQVTAIKRMADKYPQAKIVIEKAANGAAVIETLAKRIPGIVPQTPIGNKEQRAAGIVPTVESGACYLPDGAPFTEDVIEEFAGFLGSAKHDDIVDAATYAILALQVSSAAERAAMLCETGAFSPQAKAARAGSDADRPDNYHAHRERLTGRPNRVR